MKRRDFLIQSAALGLAAAMPFKLSAVSSATDRSITRSNAALSAPAHGSIPVAFLISEGAVVIDFCGPWEVFQDANVPGRNENPFQLYTVAETMRGIRTSGGMKVTPDFDFKNAPAPKVIVIPAQSGQSAATLDWIRASAKTADLTMSVCTGAFLLAKTGLLSGKSVTTHHSGYKPLAMQYPDIKVVRGVRFVEDGNIASAGGLSCGIDLALRVVERYYGRQAAEQTAFQMEYQGQGWLHPQSNEIYAKERMSTEAHPLCPVCDMDVDPAVALKSTYKGKIYYFCSQAHQQQFNVAPERFIAVRKL